MLQHVSPQTSYLFHSHSLTIIKRRHKCVQLSVNMLLHYKCGLDYDNQQYVWRVRAIVHPSYYNLYYVSYDNLMLPQDRYGPNQEVGAELQYSVLQYHNYSTLYFCNIGQYSAVLSFIYLHIPAIKLNMCTFFS